MSRFAFGALVASGVALALILATASCDDTPSEPRSGADLFVEVGCVNCHGFDAAGMKGFAPTLRGKQSYWTRATLVAYFKNPAEVVAKDARLKQQLRGFSLPMPPVVLPFPVEYERLADYVLALP